MFGARRLHYGPALTKTSRTGLKGLDRKEVAIQSFGNDSPLGGVDTYSRITTLMINT